MDARTEKQPPGHSLCLNDGESFSGKHFRMTADFGCGGFMVGDMTSAG